MKYALVTDDDGNPVEAYLERSEKSVQVFGSDRLQRIFDEENVNKVEDAIGSPAGYYNYEVGTYVGAKKKRFEEAVAKLEANG